QDGHLDIFIVNGSRLDGFPAGEEPTNHLYRNKGNATFADVTAQAGLVHSGWGQGVCVGDYDNDGDSDLFVSYYGSTNKLYRNNGDGTFGDVSVRSGIQAGGDCYGLSAIAADFENRGWPDIYVACDSTPSLLYHNNGNSTFREIGLESGVALNPDGFVQAGMGLSVGDYDGDG